MFALFDCDEIGPHRANLASGANQARFSGELSGLAVVENQQVHAFEERDQIVPRDFNPQIHRIGDDEFWGIDLIQHMRLERRGDICEQHKGSGAIARRKIGGKVLKHIELHRSRYPSVQIPHVFARPAEGFPRHDLQALRVDFTIPK